MPGGIRSGSLRILQCLTCFTSFGFFLSFTSGFTWWSKLQFAGRIAVLCEMMSLHFWGEQNHKCPFPPFLTLSARKNTLREPPGISRGTRPGLGLSCHLLLLDYSIVVVLLRIWRDDARNYILDFFFWFLSFQNNEVYFPCYFWFPNPPFFCF